MMGIYQIRNLVNDKIYIGSAIHLTRRWAYHVFTMRRNKSCCRILQKAWNKYGEDNFLFEVIEEVKDKTKLLEREQFYLDTLKPFDERGYNICIVAGSNLGLKRSAESCARISAGKKGIRTRPRIPVIQFDLNNNYIKEWQFPIDASRELKLGKNETSGAVGIATCARGKVKTAFGFIWKYKTVTQ